MPQTISMTAELEEQIQRIHEAREEFYRVDLSEVTLRDALMPLQASIEMLRTTLPEIAAKGKEFYFAEEYLDGEDYEKVYENAALAALYVMMDSHSLERSNDFSGFESALNSLSEDLSNLVSYCSGWDWERGVFANPTNAYDSI